MRPYDADANYLYQLYTISLARFDNQEAARYISLRADLDTANILWQNDAWRFLHQHMADYNGALAYFERALKATLSMYEDQSDWVATLYNNIALFYAHQGDKATALDYYNRALEIYVQLYGDDDARTQLVRNNISKLAEF